MKYTTANKPLQCMMTQSTCYRQTRTMEVKGILWHSTGVNNPWLSRYVQPDDGAANRAELLKKIGKNKYNHDWNHIYHEAGMNGWIGKLDDGTVAAVQTMPWNYRPWGCYAGINGSCNNGWIQFEICEDNLKDKKYFEAAYKEACELTAYLCKLYNIDPNGTVSYNGVKVPTILCHQDSYRLGLGSNHSDIYNWFDRYGYDMTNVRKDVAALLKPAPVTPPTPAANTATFKAGDVVKIIGSKYYSGKEIPSWVKNKSWIVYSVSGDRVVINKSLDGDSAIMSPIKAGDLALSTANVVEVGDTVKITGTKYYSGATIPSWVRNLNWIVQSAEAGSDRVIINKSADKRYAIMSPIKRGDLVVVKKH